MVRPLVAGVACMAIVAACGARKHAASPQVASSQTMSAPPDSMPRDPRAEIEGLYREIEQQRGALDLPEPPAPAAGAQARPMASVPLSTDATCKPAKTDRCTQSCTFSDSICKNAERICELAAQMPQDTWAADKCERATQTCETAHDSCCGCQ